MARDPYPGGKAWRAFLAELAETYPDHVGRIRVSLSGGRAFLEGEVPSEGARARIVARVRQLPGVRDVLDALVVAAPLAPATPWDAPAGDLSPAVGESIARASPSAADEGTRIVRHPSIVPQGPAVHGRRLRIMVDLALAPDDDTKGAGVSISDLDEDWDSLRRRILGIGGSNVPALKPTI